MDAAPRHHPALSLDGRARIAVVGTTGAGKTTLATQLARHLGVPRIELDALHWGPDWTPVPAGQFRAAADAATARDRWVADGNYGAVRTVVWARADTLIWLDYPLAVNFWRPTRRNLSRIARGEELWHGNRATFRSQFLSRDSLYLWAIQSHRRHRREWFAILASDPYRHLAVLRLRTPGATRRWLARVTR